MIFIIRLLFLFLVFFFVNTFSSSLSDLKFSFCNAIDWKIERKLYFKQVIFLFSRYFLHYQVKTIILQFLRIVFTLKLYRSTKEMIYNFF